MMRAEAWLTWLLRLTGAVMATASLTLLLPNATMAQVHSWLGLGPMPQGPIVEYLARSCSLLYAIQGILLLVVAANVRRYWSLIPILLWLHVAGAVVLLAVDLHAGMPAYWTWSEGPPIALFSLALIALWRRADRETAGAEASS